MQQNAYTTPFEGFPSDHHTDGSPLAKTTLTPGRPLSTMERAGWLARFAGTHNCLAIAEIEGPLTAESVQYALDHLQRRHAILRMGISEERGRPYFRETGAHPIPLRVVDAPKGHWIEEAEHELATHLPCATGPLIRCVLIRHGPHASTLLLNYFHSVADGYGCAYLLRDLLEAASHYDDPHWSLGPSLPVPPSLHERLPRTHKGLRAVMRLLWHLLKEFVAHIRKGGNPRRLMFEHWPSYEHRRSRILAYEFGNEFTERLVARAREEHTTVHGALCAASLLAVSRVMTDGSPRTLACTSSVNMRSRLDPPVQEEQGLFVSVLWSVQTVWKDKPFWGLAQEVSNNLHKKIQEGIHYAVVASSDWIVPFLEKILPKGRRGSLLFARIAEATMINYKGTGVSNGGAMRLDYYLGPFRITSYRGGVTLLNTGYFTALVSTFNGRLYINYVYNEPIITRPRAQLLAETAVALLRTAVEKEARIK